MSKKRKTCINFYRKRDCNIDKDVLIIDNYEQVYRIYLRGIWVGNGNEKSSYCFIVFWQ